MNYKKAVHLFILGSILLFAIPLQAQTSVEQINFVDINNDISQVAVSTITQDHYGFIWIGTNGTGLYRFDGIDYKSYKHKVNDTTSLNSSLIHCSFLDSKNRLWVGTEDGLSLYDRDLDRFKRITFEKNDVERDSNFSVFTLTADTANNLFIGSFENGFFRLTEGDSIIRRIPSVAYSADDLININTIRSNQTIGTYAATSIGLQKLNTSTDQFELAQFQTAEGKQTFELQSQSILLDKDAIWVGTVSKGIYKIEKGRKNNGGLDEVKHFEITNKRILSMVQLKDDSIMLGTENDGLLHIDRNGNLLKTYISDKTNKNSISSNSIWSLLQDKNDRIWIGYYNSGMGIYDNLYDKFNGLESLVNNSNSLEVGSVTGIFKGDFQKIWISMDGGGIDIYDPTKNEYTHLKDNDRGYTGLTNSDMQTIFFDSKKNLWAGSWNHGLYFLKNGTKKFINYSKDNLPEIFKSNSIMSFDEDSKGTIWIGTFYNGIISFNPDENKFKHHNSKSFIEKEIHTSAVRKVLVDSKDRIWVGTTKGLFKVTKKDNDDFLVESMADKIARTNQSTSGANHILSLYESRNGVLWIGTRGSGLSSYDQEKDIYTSHNESFKLQEENISSIIESENGNIWISGNSGISKLDLSIGASTNYTFYDGLLSDDFNFNAVHKDAQGILYFGNYKGVDYFDPKTIRINNSVPSLRLTDFKLSNKDVTPNEKNSPLKKVIAETDDLVLSHDQSIFTIGYTGINYTRPEKNQYAYYLEGLENDWNYVGGLRSATYTNLDHGEYTFKLKAANNDGVWNKEPLNLKIKILPPWWKTNFAISSYLALFFLSVYLLNKVTRNRIKEKQLIKNERSRRIQEGKLHEKKLQFFTNISHEFRTPLTLIINPLEDIMKDEKLELPYRIKEKHNIIHKNTERLYRLINELMDFRKLELNKVRIKARQIDVVSFTKDIVGYFNEEAFNRNIQLNLDSDLSSIPLWADERMLEKIIFNILSNAVKATPEGGVINIDISSSDKLIHMPLVSEDKPLKVVEIAISDTGPGIEKEEVEKIFERFYQVENMNKTYYGGTGIGLEVVQNFVQLHKGKVKVKSKIGKGTTFKIIFPEGKNHFEENELLKEETKSITTKERFFRKSNAIVANEESKLDLPTRTSTLLIVEDNSELRKYLKDELKSQYKVLVAKDGLEGLKIAKDSLPDVIITDVIMPEMDGFEFCKNIKEDLTTSHIPLLMLTAKTKIDDRIEGIGLGADAYMIKPFDMRLLKLRLQQLITSRKLIFDKYFGTISGAEDNANASSLDKDFIQRVLNYVHENMSDSDLSVEFLASQLNLSRSQLYRKIKTLTGQTVNEFLRKVRLQRAKQIIETESDVNISEVCYQVGFSSPSYFTKCFKSHFGILPTEVIKKRQVDS